MEPIKIALVGIGNCASSFVQGIEYYRHVNASSGRVSGLLYNSIGGYYPSHLKVVAGIDVNLDKVEKDIADAIFTPPNNARKFADVPHLGVKVSPGFIGDGIAREVRRHIPRLVEDPDKVVQVLRESGAEICVNFLPTGAENATRFYVEASLEAGVSLINAIPALLDDPIWDEFEKRGLAYAGHDMMGQIGATVFNTDVVELIVVRGGTVDKIVQLNEGPNMDFLNLVSKDRRTSSKVISKTARLVHAAGTDKVLAGPGSYNPSVNGDRKIARITIEGRQFGNIPILFELRQYVVDSPNAAWVITDIARMMRVWRERGGTGYLPTSEWYFKYPRDMLPLTEAERLVEEFIAHTCT